MNLTRCNQGHFYDADKYSTCPHCDPSAQSAASAPSSNDGATMPLFPQGASAPSNDQGATQPLFPNANANAAANAGATSDPGATQPIFMNNNIGSNSNSSTPATQPINSSPVSGTDDTGKTVAMFPTKAGKLPVVGWLVCTKGPQYGDDFRLVSGKNFIGRNNSMDVSLSKDNSVSRDKHVTVIYEPNDNIFIVQAGESKQLAYLNGSVILTAKELKAYDEIKVGKSVLTFVPLCCDKFEWTEDTEDDSEK